MKALLVILCVALTGCQWLVRLSAPVDVLVLAPHPDDEVLMAGGVISRALAEGRRVEVVVVTNGDFTCARDGSRRHAETLAALADLGLSREQVHFLGFADGHLNHLRGETLNVERRSIDGACRASRTTELRVVPSWLPESQPLTADALAEDLTVLLGTFRPRDVYLPHGVDQHPDHAMTYVFFRRAIDRLETAPIAHRAVVHATGCWPATSCDAPLSLGSAMPSPLGGYEPDERVAVDANAKLKWLGRYQSQLDGALTQDWLSSFARTDEAFFTERYERRRGRWLTLNASLDLNGASATSRTRRGSFIERCTWSKDFTSVVLEPVQ